MSSDVIERKSLPAGSIIFKKDDAANNAYVVQDGLVEIYATDGEKVHIIATIPHGGIFGEMALIDDAPRMASARMAKGGTLMIINKATIDKKLAKADPFIKTLLNIFVQTIRRLSDEKK